MSLSSHELQPYRLFRAGYDTLEIANLFGMSEASVLRLITIVRSARLDLPYPYPPHRQPAVLALPKVAYREDWR